MAIKLWVILMTPFLMGDTCNECKNEVLASVKLITDLGFFIHQSPSKMILKQSLRR